MADQIVGSFTVDTAPLPTALFPNIKSPFGVGDERVTSLADLQTAILAPLGSAAYTASSAYVPVSGLASGIATFLATPTSANLAAALTDEVGTNKIAFTDSPTIVTPTFTTNITVPLIKSAGAMIFQTNGTTTALTLGTDPSATFAGSVGIRKTTAIVANLDIVGNFFVRATSGAEGSGDGMEFSTNASLPRIDFIIGGTYTAQFSANAGALIFKNYVNNTGNVNFQTITSSVEFSRLYIKNNGQIGLTNASPGARLDMIVAANEIGLKATGYSVTGSGTTSMLDLAGTLNGTGIVHVIMSSITKTATDAASTHLNLKTDGSSVFSVGILGGATALSFKSGAPAGGTSGTWKLGVAASVSPTAPNRTVELDIGGTLLYLAAKTTND